MVECGRRAEFFRPRVCRPRIDISMPVFNPRDLRALRDSYATLQGRLDTLADAYSWSPYRTEAGRDYTAQGFLRRFNTMHERPSGAILYDATVFIQSFVMNTFGALDNLAWIE